MTIQIVVYILIYAMLKLNCGCRPGNEDDVRCVTWELTLSVCLCVCVCMWAAASFKSDTAMINSMVLKSGFLRQLLHPSLECRAPDLHYANIPQLVYDVSDGTHEYIFSYGSDLHFHTNTTNPHRTHPRLTTQCQTDLYILYYILYIYPSLSCSIRNLRRGVSSTLATLFAPTMERAGESGF